MLWMVEELSVFLSSHAHRANTLGRLWHYLYMLSSLGTLMDTQIIDIFMNLAHYMLSSLGTLMDISVLLVFHGYDPNNILSHATISIR
jgi:hypothetical protein